MKKAVAYCRFSSDNQREESITAQKRAIIEYCNENDIMLTKVYADEAKTGTSDSRDEFQKMIKELYKDIDYVIVHKYDRFARDKYDHYYYESKLIDKDIQLISVLEKFDNSPESGLLKSIIIGMNEFYSKNLSREVYKGMKENALQARFNGGTPPLGYDIDDNGKYIINEKEAKIVQLIFYLRIEGYSYQDTANYLNDLGYRTKSGKKFNRNSFYDLIRNEKYIGKYVFGVNDSSGKKRNYRKKNHPSRIITIENAIPQIIDEETFYKAIKKKVTKNMKTRNYLMTGIIKCGCCGAPMVGTSKSNSVGTKYYYYMCNERCGNLTVRADKVEEHIISTLKNHIITESNIDVLSRYMYGKYLEDINNSQGIDVKDLEKELKEINKQIDNITNALTKYQADSLIEKLKVLEEEKVEIETNISLFKNTEVLSYETMKKELMIFLSFDELNFDEKKSVIKLLIDNIKCEGKNITIKLNNIPEDLCVPRSLPLARTSLYTQQYNYIFVV